MAHLRPNDKRLATPSMSAILELMFKKLDSDVKCSSTVDDFENKFESQLLGDYW